MVLLWVFISKKSCIFAVVKQLDISIMANGKLNKNISDKLSFVSFIIPEFAFGYKMGMQDAYFYLKKYGGMDFLNECWWSLHTDNPLYAIRDMAQVCRHNGGYLK